MLIMIECLRRLFKLYFCGLTSLCFSFWFPSPFLTPQSSFTEQPPVCSKRPTADVSSAKGQGFHTHSRAFYLSVISLLKNVAHLKNNNTFVILYKTWKSTINACFLKGHLFNYHFTTFFLLLPFFVPSSHLTMRSPVRKEKGTEIWKGKLVGRE